MKLHSTMVVVSCLVLLSVPSTGDECASYGTVAEIDVPKDGIAVVQNIRFRVGLFRTCGGVEGGPEHRFRVVDKNDIETTHRRYFWTDHFLEVTPAEPLKPGSWRLQVRRPVTSERLGKWETLVQVKVKKGLDVTAPRFEGTKQAKAEAVAGTVFLSPCEAETGWVVRTTIQLYPAEDDHSGRSELFYMLERRAKGDREWKQFRTFRPENQSFSIERDHDWEQVWEYRVRVRDMAGNETVGKKVTEVHNPAKPAGQP
jgi:hypothetical protein